jgi:predicted ATPase/DNA-binding winged helix-turn-helix (wHTH) protein
MVAGDTQASGEQVLNFGPFRLRLPERVLHEGERPIRLGSRSFEILLALVERAGEVVGRDEIMHRVWPNMVTEDATLRVHMTALRKALGQGRNGARYVENVTGRGYRFVAPVTRLAHDGLAAAMPVAATKRRHDLPAPLTRMLGRTDIVGTLAARLPEQRFVTIVGPGGMGKTTIALAIADQLSAAYRHGACFVELASIVDSRLVSSTLASVLGLELLSEDPVPVLLAFLADKQLLIVLDNCEHVIEATATLAEQVLRGAPGVHVLATSREPLRSKGEWVHRLSPLGTPPSSAALTAAEALQFPAIELFTERATASLDSFELDDADAALAAEVCRRLDGIPLAIEFAAARVDLFGLRGLATRLEDCLQLLTKGRRTALPRQQTLRATLDWSYRLLSSAEQAILRRIAVFPGSFDLAGASAVAADGEVGAADVLDGISDLGAKSLVTADVTGEQVLFRLLDTTRSFALEQLAACDESGRAQRRHAELCCADWEAAETQLPGGADRLLTYHRKIDDVRAALAWCFSPEGDASIGVRLTAVTAPLWFQLSVVDEYRIRLERALSALKKDSMPDAVLEMRLNAGLGLALLHTAGPTPAAAAAFNRAIEIANLVGDAGIRWQAFWGLGMVSLVGGDYSAAVELSQRCRGARIDADDLRAIMSDRLLALAHHYAGSHATARHHAERVLHRPIGDTLSLRNTIYHIDHRVAARATLCQILWVQGLPEQALRAAHDSVEDGLSARHALSLCFALIFACPVALWAGDMAAATRLVAMLLDHSSRHSLAFWQLWGRGLDEVLQLRRGDTAEKLRRRLALLQEPLISSMHLETLGTLSEELAGAEVIARAETGRAGWCTAEILRAKGEIILKSGASGAAAAAETLFRRSLETARRQDALSWELRAATSMARLWRDQQRIREAHDLLKPIYARFTEGFGTADLVTAKRLLEQLAA